MKENEEKNSSTNQIFKEKNKENNEGLHYKKIKIKHLKKDEKDDIDINIHNPNNISDNINKNKINPNVNKMNQHLNKNNIENDKNFMFEDINNQLDEILENIENDGIDEINKKIKFLKEDKNMFNTISYNDDIKDNDWNFKKIDNKNKHTHKRNKFPHQDMYNNTMSNFKHYNNKHFMTENRDTTNKRFLFTSMNNNSYRHWKEENNCNNDDDSDSDDKNLNKTNISLFYKYNNYYNSKKNEEE